MKRAKSSIEITNFLKKNGFEVSTSYGRNAGSSVVRRKKGFKVRKNDKYAILGKSEVIIYYRVECYGIDSEPISAALKEGNYLVLKTRPNEVFVGGVKVRDYKP